MLHYEYLIAPIVEGHGEVEAVPALLNNWFRFRRFTNFRSLDKAVRAPGAKSLLAPYDRERQLGIEYYVRLAAGSRPDAILVILDADEMSAMTVRHAIRTSRLARSCLNARQV
jgi:hypothetical protein